MKTKNFFSKQLVFMAVIGALVCGANAFASANQNQDDPAKRCLVNAELYGTVAIEDLSGPGSNIGITPGLTHRLGGNDSQTTFAVSGYESRGTVEWGAVVTLNNFDCSLMGSFAYYLSPK